jgi:hypothetical protein
VAAEEDDDGQIAKDTRTDARARQPDWDPVEQQVLVDGWLAEIQDAADETALTEIGQSLMKAKRSRELSPASYDHLAQAGAKRKAELNGAAA